MTSPGTNSNSKNKNSSKKGIPETVTTAETLTTQRAAESTGNSKINNTDNDDVKVVDAALDNDNDKHDDDDANSETASLEIGACCLCHCALDFSDRAAFFEEDRHEDYKQSNKKQQQQDKEEDGMNSDDSGSDSENENDGQSKDKEDNDDDDNGDDENGNHSDSKKNEDDQQKIQKAGGNTTDDENDNKDDNCKEEEEDHFSAASSEYFFRPDDPYLAENSNLYDAHNALVYCDTEGCNRMYHQKCHFVPVLTLPRGAWHCLVCTCQSAAKAAAAKRAKNKKAKAKKANAKTPSPKKKVTGKNSGVTSGKKGTSATKATKTATAAVLEPITTPTGDDHDVDEVEQQQQVLLQTEDLFRSPPVAVAKVAEVQWEYASRHYKAAAWTAELEKRLKQAVRSQLGNYRSGVMAAETLTSTQKNRQFFSKHGGSQELAQSLVKLFGAKFKLREFCHNLEKVRRTSGKPWRRLQVWTDEWIANNKQDGNDFVERVLFPFGRQHPCRLDPRTPEMKLVLGEQAQASTGADANKDKDPEKIASVPDEIIVSTTNASSAAPAGVGVDQKGNEKGGKRNKIAPSSKSAGFAAGSKKSHTAGKKCAGNAKHDDDDDNSGISLDDLKCCVCHQGTATDDNDLILCDGSGCYRAYHMQCCKPEITAQDLEDETADWFCPICSCSADLLLLIQGEYMGDEWEQRRYGLQMDGKETTGSVKSWDAVDDIFPEAEWEYEAACLLKEGKRNTATKQLLAQVLGLDSLPDDDDHDDVEEDAHFDPSTFDTERQRAREALEEKESDDDDDSSHSSQATLADMSIVELEIDKGELAALSEPEDDDDDEEGSKQESENGEQIRRSRRIRKYDSTNASSDNGDPGRFDETNIVEGKRGRKPVDYKKLNEAIFGDLPDAEAAKLDDTDDFEMKETRKKISERSDDESGEEEEDDEKKEKDEQNDEADEKKEEGEQHAGADEEEPPCKKARKHEPPMEQEDDSNATKVEGKKAAESEKAAPSSPPTPRSNAAKGKQVSPSIAQAAISMVSKLVGGGREGTRRNKR